MSIPIERGFVPTPEVLSQRGKSLREEAEYLHENWRIEGLRPTWRYLDHTGFHVKTQVDMLYNDLGNVPYIPYGEVVNNWLQKTGEDLHGFVVEYLAQRCVFPIRYSITEIGEEHRVVAPQYGNVLMVDTVSDKERNGVVKKTLAETVEPALLLASNGDTLVIISKDGPSGLYDSERNEIIHKDSQTYILQKRGDEIVGFTVRTDLAGAEHREIIRRLGGKQLSEDASDEEYYANVVLLKGRSYQDGFEEVVRAMEDVRGGPYAYKERLWSEIYVDLAKREGLWEYGKHTNDVINEFSDIVWDKEMNHQELEELLATAILRLSRKVLGEELKSRISDGVSMSYQQSFTDIDGIGSLRFLSYSELLSGVEKLAGCNGGGEGGAFSSVMQALMLSVTPRLVANNIEKVMHGEGVCEHCQKSSTDNHYHCPKCNREFADETELLPSQRTAACECGNEFGC